MGKFKSIKNLHIDQIIFILSLIAKQFYFFHSGSFQIGDILMVISFALCFVIRRQWKFNILFNNWEFGIFCLFALIINTTYCVLNDNQEFIKPSLFLIFNFLIVILFSYYLQEKNNLDFLKLLKNGLFLNLLIQLTIFILGKGRLMNDGLRYMGTFNDPNQYAVFVFFSFLAIFIISKMIKKNCFISFFLSFYLLVQSASSGIMLGFAVFVVFYIILKIKELVGNNTFVLYLLVFLFIVVLFFIGIKNGKILLPQFITDSFMYERLSKRISNTTIISIVEERAWSPLFEYPEKLLYGAGEGLMSRFHCTNEVHSTILALFFYYGFLPTIILLRWICNNIKGIKCEVWPAYIALFVESMFLANYRQPLFWIIIILASHSLAKKVHKLI